jgi:hypothetical protein
VNRRDPSARLENALEGGRAGAETRRE